MLSPRKMVEYLNGLEQRAAVQECFVLLKTVPTNRTQVPVYDNILKTLTEIVAEVPVGLAEFLKMNGYNMCLMYLQCQYETLRKRACTLIVETAQNNPPAQLEAKRANLIPELIKLKGSDMERKRSMSAISVIIRGDSAALSLFLHTGGEVFVKEGLSSLSVETSTKFAFFLHSAFYDVPDSVEDLRQMKFVEALLEKIKFAVQHAKITLLEHLYHALLTVVEGDNRSILVCQDPENDLKQNLQLSRMMFPAEQNPDCAEYISKLSAVVFNTSAE